MREIRETREINERWRDIRDEELKENKEMRS